MDLSPEARAIVEAYAEAAWLACDPATTTPGEVAEFGNETVIALREDIEAGEHFSALLMSACAYSIHTAMVVRGMFLDAVDLFARVNAIANEIGAGSILQGMTYTDYVESILDKYNRA